ncbi:hypothetical protein AB0N16_17775 [Streptomyces sp. NPDC051105]|uniref:hypothetical protein n=1 Tax=Streptomyces sp. NPDC051105 TaxID=3154843 RepID=UPI00342413B0
MTPRPRSTLGGVRLALVRLLLVLATVLLPYDTAVAYDPEPVSSDSAGASASPEPSRAGTLAGEGRLRPGRPQGPEAAVQGQDEDEPGEDEPGEDEPGEETDGASPAATSAEPPREAGVAPTPSPSRSAHQAVAHSEEDASEPVLHILPLGSGLVLIGLGLALAFVALRVRRS